MTTTHTSGAADLPEALRLADWMQNAVATYPQMSEDEPGGYCQEIDQVMDQAAAELRRLHNESVEVHAGYRTEQYWQGWNAALAAGQAVAPAADQDGEVLARQSFPTWWQSAGAKLCGANADLPSREEVIANRGWMAGFIEGISTPTERRNSAQVPPVENPVIGRLVRAADLPGFGQSATRPAPPAMDGGDAGLEAAAQLLESQHTWITNVAAANLVRGLAARAAQKEGEKP